MLQDYCFLTCNYILLYIVANSIQTCSSSGSNCSCDSNSNSNNTSESNDTASNSSNGSSSSDDDSSTACSVYSTEAGKTYSSFKNFIIQILIIRYFLSIFIHYNCIKIKLKMLIVLITVLIIRSYASFFAICYKCNVQ